MADYTTHFSTMFDVLTPENVDRALDIYADLAREIEEEDETSLNFALDPERDAPRSDASTKFWIHDEDYGDPGHVIAFVTRCAEALELDGRWGFVWSHDCSKPRLDGYGGGAAVVDLATGQSTSIEVSNWLRERLAGAVAVELSSPMVDLLTVLKEVAQPMGLSAHDFVRWLPRAQTVVARAEAALGRSARSPAADIGS